MLLIIIVAGLLSFGGTFAVGWLTKSKEPAVAESANIAAEPHSASNLETTPAIGSLQKPAKLTMAEREMKSLIFDLREKGNEYNTKLKDLKTEEDRLNTTRTQIQADIEELNTLRLKLTDTVAKIKSDQDKLEKSRIKIGEEESKNLIRIAATYDKMDPAAASKILISICRKPGSEKVLDVENMEDAVKILYFMGERTKGELLAEMANKEEKLAAMFTQSLKLISIVN